MSTKFRINEATALGIIGLAVSLAALLIGLRSGSTTATTVAVALAATTNLITFWADRHRAFVLIGFTTTFCLFLMGRQTLNLFVGTPADEAGVLGSGAIDHMTYSSVNLMLYVALAGLFIGWAINRSASGQRKPADGNFLDAVRAGAATTLIASAPFALYSIYLAASSVSTLGFYSGRLTATSGPIWLRIMAALFDLSFFAFLSGRPAKKQALWACVLYVAMATASLATLGRAEFVLSLGIVAIYLYHRQQAYGEQWFTFRRSAILVAGSPLLLFLLNSIGSMRGRNAALSGGVTGPIYDFIRSQGVSIKVLVYADEYSGFLPSNRFYSFGPVIEFLQKILSSITTTTYPKLSGQSAERAVEGHQLAHTLSYLISPVDYLRGTGYGSSYVAELFIDFGLGGVLVGSVIYGLLLTRSTSLLNRSAPVVFVTLMLVKGALFVPRSSLVQPLVDPFSTPSLLAFPLLMLAILANTHVPRSRRYAHKDTQCLRRPL